MPHVREKTPEEGLPEPGTTTTPIDEAAATAETTDSTADEPQGDAAEDDASA